MSTVVELRGPCNHLAATLDIEHGVIQRKCPQCSRDAGKPVYHYFDAATGAPVAEPSVSWTRLVSDEN